MRRILAIAAILMLGMAAAHAAEPHVGKLDGKPGPSLPPVPTPVAAAPSPVAAPSAPAPLPVQIAPLADTTFPQLLESQGETQLALLKWQRLSRQLTGPARTNALIQTARLQLAQGYAQAVSQTVATFIEENPPAAAIPQMMYYLAQSQAQNPAAQAQTIAGMQKAYPDAPQTQKLVLSQLLGQARTGTITNNFNDTLGMHMQYNLNVLNQQAKNTGTVAAAFGLVPGLGLIALGMVGQGVILFVVWSLFTLAFLSACRHRHYSYAFVFALPAFGLWLNSPLVSLSYARLQAHNRLEQTVNQWQKHYLPNKDESQQQ